MKIKLSIIKLIVFVATILLLASCGVPSKSDVEIDFLKYKPNMQIISIKTGEGDFDNTYFYVKYKSKMNSFEKIDVLLYQVDTSNNWILKKHWKKEH